MSLQQRTHLISEITCAINMSSSNYAMHNFAEWNILFISRKMSLFQAGFKLILLLIQLAPCVHPRLPLGPCRWYYCRVGGSRKKSRERRKKWAVKVSCQTPKLHVNHNSIIRERRTTTTELILSQRPLLCPPVRFSMMKL